MKKLLAALALALPAFTQASVIYTDEALFLADYENPTGTIDFSATPRPPSYMNVGPAHYYYGESWLPGVVFETRRYGNLNILIQGVVQELSSDSIRANPDIENGTITIDQYRPQQVLAIFTNLGFFGWAPELNTSFESDFLFQLPMGATISKVEYGFSKVAHTPEPSSLLLLLIGLPLVFFRKEKRVQH